MVPPGGVEPRQLADDHSRGGQVAACELITDAGVFSQILHQEHEVARFDIGTDVVGTRNTQGNVRRNILVKAVLAFVVAELHPDGARVRE